ncbi:Uncharacterized protein PECH_008452 [Penicillium ucsense]|uniref:Enoyl reductase (ER) domain-containing protein n=1 Tax=Penicillium ucsense TaxID=2839758 RepID=A0A8J8WIT4_9EURO|nr:Uncharacterized protein PECM_003697 [Penicillium ucsense]KAF7734137.1 Uncharacterized protein PECH_008452 [Penicillium ucsense]
MSSPPSKHMAAVVPAKGQPLSVEERSTPTCGPKEVLIEVHAVALNPVDHVQRDLGLFLDEYPAVVGSDLAGIVVSNGSENGSSTPKPGTRVIAFGSAFFHRGQPDYGALQQYVLVSEDSVAALPDSYSFVEGAMFPMAAVVAWNAWFWAGLSIEPISPSEKKGILIWGASSSMGAFAVQTAKLLGYTVYATASSQHHAYLETLGAARVFDYKRDSVSAEIMGAAEEDGLSIEVGLHATGSQQTSIDVMSRLAKNSQAKLAIAPLVDKDAKIPDNVQTAFVQPPASLTAREERMSWIFGTWLREHLAAKQLVASPHIKVVPGGLQAANQALDELKAGVSCTKLVLEL